MKLIVVFLIVLFLFVSPVEAMPLWSQNQTSIASGSQYSPRRNYKFQINWTDSVLGKAGISKVIFESDFSGVLMNYSRDTNPAVLNNTAGIYWINFTDPKAGSYSYRWYANNTSDYFSSTDQWNYLINKNSSYSLNLTLNRTEGNRSYDLNQIANFTGSINLANKTIYLDSSYPGWILQSGSTVYNVINLSSRGSFRLTVYWNGDENYSSFSKTYFFDNMPPQFSDAITSPFEAATYFPGTKYIFNISWSDATLNKIWFESNYTGSFINYTANQTGIVLKDFPSKMFLYRWIASDSINKMNATNRVPYRIFKAAALRMVATPSSSVKEGTITEVFCSSSVTELNCNNFKLYRNSTLISNISLLTRMDSSKLSPGVYEYICNTTGTQNYTNQSLSLILRVNLSEENVSKMFNITNASDIQINAGNSAEVKFFLMNGMGKDLYNLTVDISGVSQSWYTIDTQNSIPDNSKIVVKIRFDIPSYAETGDYDILIKAQGRTSSNEIKTTNKSIVLTVKSRILNIPPSYSSDSTNTSVSGEACEFSLRWIDDTELSGFIFSSNITGSWQNDSWILLYGNDDLAKAIKLLNLPENSTISWKMYANDSNNAWTDSEEFYLTVTAEKQADYTLLIAIGIVVIFASTVVLIVIRRFWFKPKKKKNIFFVYRKEDL